MVEMSLFRSRAFSGGTITMMLWAFGVFGIYFFTSIYLQNILGFSPTKAGLAFVPMALCLALVAGLAGPVSRFLRAHRPVALGTTVMPARPHPRLAPRGRPPLAAAPPPAAAGPAARRATPGPRRTSRGVVIGPQSQPAGDARGR